MAFSHKVYTPNFKLRQKAASMRSKENRRAAHVSGHVIRSKMAAFLEKTAAGGMENKFTPVAMENEKRKTEKRVG